MSVNQHAHCYYPAMTSFIPFLTSFSLLAEMSAVKKTNCSCRHCGLLRLNEIIIKLALNVTSENYD